VKKHLLANVGNLVDVKLSEGRLVIVGDTHGQLADFCWLLRSHGLPAKDNLYLINGDVADRGQHAVEILLLVRNGTLPKRPPLLFSMRYFFFIPQLARKRNTRNTGIAGSQGQAGTNPEAGIGCPPAAAPDLLCF
jgi:hypothetical protein